MMKEADIKLVVPFGFFDFFIFGQARAFTKRTKWEKENSNEKKIPKIENKACEQYERNRRIEMMTSLVRTSASQTVHVSINTRSEIFEGKEVRTNGWRSSSVANDLRKSTMAADSKTKE
jgi:hypothetical protein